MDEVTTNEERPQELSSRRASKQNHNFNETSRIDPRFESYCCSFSAKNFDKEYSFINKIRKRERTQLIKELKNPATDLERKETIRLLIQRINNSIKSSATKKRKEMIRLDEQRNHIEALKRGENPRFKKKSEKKIKELMDQYELLKDKGKLKSHIRSRKKKLIHKDRKEIMM